MSGAVATTAPDASVLLVLVLAEGMDKLRLRRTPATVTALAPVGVAVCSLLSLLAGVVSGAASACDCVSCFAGTGFATAGGVSSVLLPDTVPGGDFSAATFVGGAGEREGVVLSWISARRAARRVGSDTDA